MSSRYTIPGSIAAISNAAFGGCSGLTSVTISDGVLSIGAGAFAECSNLTNVTIPDSVNMIGPNAFAGCDQLARVIIPADARYEKGAFPASCSVFKPSAGSKGLVQVDTQPSRTQNAIAAVLKNDLKAAKALGVQFSEDNQTLLKCPENVTSAEIPSGVTAIGEGAFANCANLTEVIMPDSVTFIGDGAFEGCRSLTRVTIPDRVTVIGNSAFCGCYKLTRVIIPDSVSSIGDAAFAGCRALAEVSFPAKTRFRALSFPKDCKIIRRNDAASGE